MRSLYGAALAITVSRLVMGSTDVFDDVIELLMFRLPGARERRAGSRSMYNTADSWSGTWIVCTHKSAVRD